MEERVTNRSEQALIELLSNDGYSCQLPQNIISQFSQFLAQKIASTKPAAQSLQFSQVSGKALNKIRVCMENPIKISAIIDSLNPNQLNDFTDAIFRLYMPILINSLPVVNWIQEEKKEKPVAYKSCVYVDRALKFVFSHDNKAIISCPSTVVEWDIISQKFIKQGLIDSTCQGRLSNKGKYLILTDITTNISTIFNLSTEPWKIEQENLFERFNKAAISPDETYALVVTDRRKLNTWNLSTDISVEWPEYKDPIEKFAISPDGTQVVTFYHNLLHFWNAIIGRCNKTVSNLCINVTVMAFSPDNNYLIIGQGHCPHLIVYNLKTDLYKTILEHYEPVYALKVSKNFMLSGSSDRMALLWSLAKLKKLTQIDHEDCVMDVAINDTETSLATVTANGCIRIFDILYNALEELRTVSLNQFKFISSLYISLKSLKNPELTSEEIKEFKLLPSSIQAALRRFPKLSIS